MKTHSNTTRQRGFSLLEMIGVMAIMAILAGALAPSVFRMIEEAYQGAEAQSLETVALALQDYVKAEKRIPAESGWVDAVADYAALAPNRVENNEKGFARKIYFDPKFFNNANKAFNGYDQTVGLNAKPYSPRIMLVSSLDANVSVALNNHKRFSAVWDQTSKAKIKESKTVFIERLNLSPLFKRVLLSNANTSQAGFELEGDSESSVAAAAGGVDGRRELYVIANTRLDLNAAPYPGGTTLRQMIVDADASIRYQTDGASWYWED